jgi:DNA-binding MarR family transcriptional regulator
MTGDVGGSPADEAWRDLMTLMALQRQRVMGAAVAEGLTMPQGWALMQLQAESPRAMRDLAENMQCDASFVTAIVDRFEELGLVERRVSPRDRRVKELVLTDAGHDAQRRLQQAWVGAPEAVQALPTRDLAELRRITRKMTADIDRDSLPPFFGKGAGRRPRASGSAPTPGPDG